MDIDKDKMEFAQALRRKTGCPTQLCSLACDYAKGDDKVAMAYVKAKTLAVATPKSSFDERVKSFIKDDK